MFYQIPRILFVLTIPILTNNYAFAETTSTSAEVVSLKQAVELAFAGSPTYLRSKTQFESAELSAKNAASIFLPNLDISASHGVRGLDPDSAGVTTKTPLVSSATLSLTENFYDNGESAKKKRIADYRLEAAKIDFESVKGQIIRSVILAYYRHNISLQKLSFTKKNFQELERLSKQVSNQFYQGLKTRKDFLSFTTRAQRSRLEVLDAETALVNARTDLLAKIGVDPKSQIKFDETVKPLLPKNSLSSNFDETSLYEYRSLHLQQQISDIEIQLARRKYWPELNLIGSANYGSSEYINTGRSWSDNDSTSWSVLLNLKFNLLDWGVRSRNVQIAALTQSSTEQQYKSELLQVQKDLEVFKVEVSRSEESYRLSKELQKMEEDTFRLLERDYRAGMSTYLELTTGLANLLDAQARGLEADYNQADLYLRWKYYKGTLSEENLFE